MSVRDQQRIADARNVLIIRLEHIGDMLVSTPAIRNIREGLPTAHITLVASPYNAPVLKGCEYLDEILAYDRNWPVSRKREFAGGLRDRHYDLCVAMYPSTESHKLAFWSKARIRAATVYSNRIVPRILAPIRLTHFLVLNIDAAAKRREYVPHEAEQLLQLLRLIGLPAKDHPLHVPVHDEDRSWATDLVSHHHLGRTLIGVHLSEKWLWSGWTGIELAQLLDEILRVIPDSSIVATYGPGDTQVAKQVAPYIESDDGIGFSGSLKGRVLMVGDVSFGRWAGLLSLCRVVVTRDTGSLHLAAALGRPVLAIYEKDNYHRDAQQWAPWKVLHYSMESGKFSETSSEVLRRLVSLLAESIKTAP